MGTTTYTIPTKTKAPLAVVYTGPRGGKPHPPTIEGYAHTEVAAKAKARRMGRFHRVCPVAAGAVTVEVAG